MLVFPEDSSARFPEGFNSDERGVSVAGNGNPAENDAAVFRSVSGNGNGNCDLQPLYHFSRTSVAEIFPLMGRSGNDVIRSGRRGRESGVSVQGRGIADSFDFHGVVLQNDGGSVMSDQNTAESEGTAFLHDRILPESDGSSCDRCGSAESGTGLRRTGLKRGGDGNPDHRAARRAGD